MAGSKGEGSLSAEVSQGSLGTWSLLGGVALSRRSSVSGGWAALGMVRGEDSKMCGDMKRAADRGVSWSVEKGILCPCPAH